MTLIKQNKELKMKLRGSLQNRISENGVYPEDMVVLGMGATITMYTDRHAATVVGIDGNIVTIQQDIAIGLKKNIEYGEQQDYKFERDFNGSVHHFRAKKYSGVKLVKYVTISFVHKKSNQILSVTDISSVKFGNSTRFNESIDYWTYWGYKSLEEFQNDYKYSGHNHKDAWTEEVEVTGVTYEPVVKNANGRWVKGGQSAYFGSRSEYYDYSF